jgi:hypothetical protein
VLTLLCTAALSAITLAQTPIAFPNTITTVAGGGTTPAKNTACATGSPFTSTDAFGNGCPATGVAIGVNEFGQGMDSFGNLFFYDNTNQIAHKLDARSGIMTAVAGAASVTGCASPGDKYGDNCVAATQTAGFNVRNLTVDPYGNVVISNYGNSLIHIVCNAVSPLCTSAQIGTMKLLAGYVTSPGSAGTGTAVAGSTAGSAGDGTTSVGISTAGSRLDA